MANELNHLKIAVNRALDRVDRKWFEEMIKEGRSLIITIDSHTSVTFKWDPPTRDENYTSRFTHEPTKPG